MVEYGVFPTKRSVDPPPSQEEQTITFIEHSFQNILRQKKKIIKEILF